MELCQEFCFYIFSPGCRTNQCDGEMLSYILCKNNFKRVYDIKKASFIIVSGCVVTKNAEKDSIRFIKKVKLENPSAKIVLSGCLAERNMDAPISSIFFDYIIPNDRRFNISEILKNNKIEDININEGIFFTPTLKMKNKVRFFFKIQEGCSENCKYCYVRIVRGKPKSLHPDEVLKHTKKLIKNNIKEIVLCGTHLGIYGKDQGFSLKYLIKEIEKIEDRFRFRLSSLEPWDLDDELIKILENSKKFCHFFHLPLQSGCDGILKKMNRPYSSDLYYELIIKIKRLFPQSRIGADLIVGFPEEGEKEFAETYNFLKKTPVDYLHIFTYSPRPSNPEPPSENISLIKERYKILKELDREKREKDKKERLNKISEALTIGKEGILRENYYCIFEKKIKRALLLPCKIVKWKDDRAIVETI